MIAFRRMVPALVAVWIAHLAFSSAAVAQSLVLPADPVPGASGVTYVDLVREIVPDIRDDNGRYVGSQMIAMDHVGGADHAMQPPERIRIDHGISAVHLGGSRHLVLVDFGQPEGEAAGFVALALFDTAATPRLLDATNVGFDLMTYFPASPVFSVGGGELAMTVSVHANSNQTYTTTALVLIRDGRLERVDDLFTFDVGACSYEWAQRLTVVREEPQPEFDNFEATVTEYIMPSGKDCGDEKSPPSATNTYIVVYEWDTAQSRYVADSDVLDVLAEQNAKRF